MRIPGHNLDHNGEDFASESGALGWLKGRAT